MQALLKAASTRIDQAVVDGKLTQAQADELEAGLEQRITDLVNGELHGPGPGFHHGFGPGFGFHGGPSGLMGPRA